MAEAMRSTIGSMLRGIERYNPENIATLERYVELQARENTYDLEANLALLKLYQFNPQSYQKSVVCLILLKALTNLPHTDFVLCKCLIEQEQMKDKDILQIMYLHDVLEMCRFNVFWEEISQYADLVKGIKDFEDSIRKYICHVISITYQHIEKSVFASLLGHIEADFVLAGWMTKYGWKEDDKGYILIGSQEETVKTKNITEKIDFDSVAGIMAACR